MSWQKSESEAKNAFKNGRYGEAIRLYENAIAQIKETEESDSLGTVYGALAEVLFRQGRFADAEDAFKKAVQCQKGSLVELPETLETAALLTNFGAFYADRQNFDEADRMLTQALTMKKKLGADQLSVSRTIAEIGILKLEQDQLKEAEPMFSQVLGIQDRELAKDDVLYAESLNNLAVLHSMKKNYALAEPLCKRALKIRESKLGLDHPSVAESLHNLGVQYLKQGRSDKAEPLWRRALAIQERTYTPDHPLLVLTLNHLGSACLSLGHFDDAISFYKRALAISERTEGGDKHNLINSVAGLGMTYLRQAKFKEAEPYIKRSLDLLDDVEEDHGSLEHGYLNELFTCYIFQGKFGDALSLVPDTMRASHTSQVNEVLDTFIKVGKFANKLFEKSDES